VEGYYGVVKSSTHTVLPTEHVHFGAGSIRKLAEEARAKARPFVVTGRTPHEKRTSFGASRRYSVGSTRALSSG
jgi:hypothetical protein